ncbi:MAG: ferredoxin [Alphaproteobacteria bacterium HGW-Alphaproteobacteria-4]|jgi:cytochrome c-type protein NapB|nr:MAG: ferredoxin [Alphaproteobacteria bacterium HGW-Alphaproteobacteria-4]
MKHYATHSAIFAAIVLAFAGIALAQTAGPGTVQSLRGAPIEQPVAIDDIYLLDAQRFSRNYRQQPPLISHSTDQYQIDLNANQCLGCHDWRNAAERKAPTLSMTHYQDRDGNQLDRVAGTRWFCNQCHVAQMNAPALVANLFSAPNGN